MVRLAVLVLAVALLAGAATTRVPATFDAREVVRLRAHFDSVEQELRSADVTALSDIQREHRARLVAWLHDYRDAGQFPRNEDFHERAMPYFRDARGTLCAMAYLVARSGRTDMVDRIAATTNNAFIRELAGDRELVAWLHTMGMSLGEAARVQPAYEPQPRPVVSYVWSSWLVSGSALVGSGFNALAPGKKSAWAGLIAGAGAIALGAANWGADGGDGNVAKANVGIGLGTLALSVRGFRYRPESARDRPAAPPARTAPAFVVTPSVQSARGKARVGVTFRTTF